MDDDAAVEQFLASMGATEGDIDAIEQDTSTPEGAAPGREGAIEGGPGSPGRGNREGSGVDAQAGADDLLRSPTRAELSDKETRAAQGERAEAQARKDRAAKADADAQVGEFRLTGSDRAADADTDQGTMFSVAEGREYPLAEPGTRYEETGDKAITMMSPDAFLSRVKPLTLDEESRDAIDALKDHIKAGRKLDPLHIRADGKEDGRHRAHAAKELGIKRVPVVDEQGSTQFSIAEPEGSKAFREWFSDSKVVNEDGTPKVIYHGTTADVTAFDPKFSGSDGVGYSAPAFFATDDTKLASDYAVSKFNREIADAMRELQSFKNENPGDYGDGYESRYQALSAALKTVKQGDGREQGGGANVMPLYMALKNPLMVDGKGQRFMAVMPDAVAKAVGLGHDGAIVRNVIDNASPATDYPATVYFALKPEQLKSATGNRGTFDPKDPDIRLSITPEQAMTLNTRLNMPTDPLFAEAVSNTPGASITERGLLMDLVRFQKAEQVGDRSVRTGVFYLPQGSASIKHYKGGKSGYGGTERFEGTTLIRNPLFVKGATGGKAPEAAYNALKGKGAYEALREDYFKTMGYGMKGNAAADALGQFLDRHGADSDIAYEMLHHSGQGNQLVYAATENIVAHAVREAGYDAVVGHSKGKAGPFISEVFDVREQTYPVEGMEGEVHEKYERNNLSAEGAGAAVPKPLAPLASLIQGKTFAAAKRVIVSQVGSVRAGEKFDDEVADAVFLRLQRVAQVGAYTDEKDVAYRKPKRLEGPGTIKLYRSAPPGVGLRPGDFAAGSKREAGFYKHGTNVIQAVDVPRADVLAIEGSSGGGQEYLYLPKGYAAPTPVEHFPSLRAFFDAVNAGASLRTAEGTSAAVPTAPANQARLDKAEKLLNRVREQQTSYVSFMAVEPGQAADVQTKQTMAALRTVAKRLFGHDTVFVRFNGAAAFNGAMSGNIPDTVFVRIDSTKPHMAILGHELLHAMRKSHPALYTALETRLRELLNDKTGDFHARIKESYDRIGREMPEDWHEELFADIVGDFFLDTDFWSGMKAEQPGLFRRVADAIVKFLDGVIAHLRDTKPFGTDQFLTDTEAARKAVTDAMRKFSQEQRAKSGVADSKGDSLSVKPTGLAEFMRGSKIVNADGSPMEVYHGTRRGLFSEFKKNAGSRSDGFVFTSNRNMALTYSGQDNSAEPGPRSTKAGLYSVYLSIKNPKSVNWKGAHFGDNEGTNKAIDQAKAEGYDGLIVRNVNDPGGYAGYMQQRGAVPDGRDVAGDLFVAFEPTQIKSSKGNSGAFDAENPDIRMSVKPTGLAAFMQGSKVVNPDGSPAVVYHGTTADFTAFDPSKRGRSTKHATALLGEYFSADPKIATEFIPVENAWGEKPSVRLQTGGNLMPAHLSIKNPYTGLHADEFRSLVSRNDPAEVKALREELEAKGHDGVFIKGVPEYADTMAAAEWGADTWVAFKPAQIKSAIGNTGAFDPENPDIRFSVADGEPPVKRSPALARAIFQGSTDWMRDQNGKPVKASEQVDKYKAIDSDERGQMLLRKNLVTAEQLKRWKASPLDVFEGAVNKRFRKHFETPGLVWSDQELRDRFKLDDEGVQSYRELRVQADISIARNAVAEMLRAAGADGHAAREQVLAEPLDVAAETLRDHLLDLADQARKPSPEPKVKMTTEERAAAEAQAKALDADEKPAEAQALRDQVAASFKAPPTNTVESRRLMALADKIIDIADAANDRMATGVVPDDMKAQARPSDWQVKGLTTFDNFVYEMQDGKVDLKRTQEAITESGRAIDERFDARLAETLHAGRVAKRTQTFKSVEAMPLLKQMANLGIKQTEFGDYLHARAAPERNAQIAKVNPDMPDGGAGSNSKGLLLTTAAARQYIADLPAEKKRRLELLAARVDAINKGTRALLVQEGLEKQETIDAWEAAYSTYVPMFREDIEFNRLTNFKRATGSEREAVNILANVLQQREAAIVRAEKNRVLVSLYGMALSNPNPDFWSVIRPDKDRASIEADLARMGIDKAEAETSMLGIPLTRDVDPVTNKVVERANPAYARLPNAVSLKVNGEMRVVMFNANDPRAMRLAQVMKGADTTEAGLVVSMVGKVTRWMAAFLTQYNPVFGIVNFIRDTQGGLVNLGNTELRGSTAKVASNLPGAMVGITAHLAGKADKGKWSVLFEQFQMDGGQTGFREAFRTGEERARNIEKELSRLSGAGRLNPLRAASAVGSLLGGFNDVMENAVRLAAYGAALDKGISRPQAARLARELTVDFNRKGHSMAKIGPMYAFMNASIQGTERTMRALRGPTGPAIVAGGMMLGMLQALMLAAAGYDDDDVPEFVKSRSLVIPLFDSKKRFITIPLPLGLHVIPNTGRVLTELVIGDLKGAGKKVWEATGTIAGAFNPLGGGNVFTLDGALKTVLPTVIDPFIELGFNRNFAGFQIERDPMGERDPRPGFQRAREQTRRQLTGQAYIGISKAINRLTGGSDYEQGLMSPTPERSRYIAQTVFGGVLRETENAINTSAKAARGEEIPKSGIPLAGRFVGSVREDAVEKGRYFRNIESLERTEAALKAAKKAGDAGAITKILADSPNAGLIAAGNNVQKAVTKLNKLAVTVIDDPVQMKAIDDARTVAMKSLNDAIESAEKQRRKPTPAELLRAAVK